MENDIKRVIALGFFDGIHVGHMAILNITAQRAEELGAAPSVLTFDAHPDNLIIGGSVTLINSPEDRADMIRRKFGIDDVLLLHFDSETMHMDWQDFLEHLTNEFGAVHLCAGYDFHFGYKGIGNTDRMRAWCTERGLGCDIVPEIKCDGITVSSTYIRKLISQGEIERANEFLGHPHTLSDTVRYGYRFGRTIGCPTINMEVPAGVIMPARGVYAAKVYFEGQEHMAVTNVGVRPTVGGKDKVTVESYILDYSGNLYGKQVRVEFYKFLRPEMKFSSVEELKSMIQKNAGETREYFSK